MRARCGPRSADLAIAGIAALGMDDPIVIPLWYREGDLPTPGFVGHAASEALAAGRTFYPYAASRALSRLTPAERRLAPRPGASLCRMRGAHPRHLCQLPSNPTGWMISDSEIAVSPPALPFGPMGEGYLRLRFARDPAVVGEAIERLRPLSS